MNKLRVDLTGKQFGRLKVLEYVNRNKQGDSRWLCLCECEKQTIVNNTDLQTGNTQSCGCSKIRHGHTVQNHRSQTHLAWSQMKQRCLNTKNLAYPSYGGRGIKVCNKWMVFNNFLSDMGEPPTAKHSLDRINNDGNYCKYNCRWATRKQQQGNMRNNHLISFEGKTQCLAAWSRHTGIGQKCLWHRLVTLGWSIEKALTTPVQKQRSKK